MKLSFEKHGARKAADHNDLYTRLLDVLPEGANVLEIGVGNGSSISAMQAYRPDLNFVGVDNCSERYGKMRPALDLITVIIGNQDDVVVLSRAAELGPYYLIIDDCSHIFEKQRASFNGLYPVLMAGGFYVIEDLHAETAGQKTRDFVEGLGLKYDYFDCGGCKQDVAIITMEVAE